MQSLTERICGIQSQRFQRFRASPQQEPCLVDVGKAHIMELDPTKQTNHGRQEAGPGYALSYKLPSQRGGKERDEG